MGQGRLRLHGPHQLSDGLSLAARDTPAGRNTPYRWFQGFGGQADAPLPVHDGVTAPVCFPAAFSVDECTAIVRLVQDQPAQRSSIGNPTEGYRQAKSRWAWDQPEWRWVYERLEQVFLRANESFRFELRGFVDPLLVATYDIGGQFEWHVDAVTGTTSTRKISLSLQLSTRESYEGGVLEFAGLGELPLSRDLGTVVCFPSFTCHRVTTVSRGTRHALIAWAHGPAFR